MRTDHRYDDILFLPRPKDPKRKHMTNLERAAQFSPFAALTGYGDAIREEERLTEDFSELGDDKRASLDQKIRFLIGREKEGPLLHVTYFLPDEKKRGGKYVTVSGKLKKLRLYERELQLEKEAPIPLDAVLSIESDVFSEWEL